MTVGFLLFLSCPLFENAHSSLPYVPSIRGVISAQPGGIPQQGAVFCRESCLLDASEDEASVPDYGTSPLHPALDARPAHLTPAGRGRLGFAHNGSWTRHAHSVRCHRKLKSALKTQPFLGMRGRNDRKNVNASRAKKKLVNLTTATLAVESEYDAPKYELG